MCIINVLRKVIKHCTAPKCGLVDQGLTYHTKQVLINIKGLITMLVGVSSDQHRGRNGTNRLLFSGPNCLIMMRPIMVQSHFHISLWDHVLQP